MLWQKEETLPFSLEDGIVVDYTQQRFVMVVKDAIWTDYEMDAFYHHRLHVDFVYERVCAIFLLECEDAIDTSDASFSIHASDEKEHILASESYDMELYLVDANNRVCAARSITYSKADSLQIRECLQKQADTPYDEEGFDRALAKIQGTYQPFELQESAIVRGKF